MTLNEHHEPPGRHRLTSAHSGIPRTSRGAAGGTRRALPAVSAGTASSSRADRLSGCHAARVPLEHLPERASYHFTSSIRPCDGRPVTVVYFNGAPLGDPLTDAAPIADYYRLHDVFHLSYAMLLDWSPVTRALLSRKRRSVPELDENEDGGRAVVVEEAISAMVFGYAARRDFLRSHTTVERCLLERITEMTAPFEVAAVSAAAWEHVILVGMRLWRTLRSHGGTGLIHADRLDRRMSFSPAGTHAGLPGEPRARSTGTAVAHPTDPIRLAG
ncbi:hypothetical protein ACPZ19_49485 [Amycolatopsis lurida]